MGEIEAGQEVQDRHKRRHVSASDVLRASDVSVVHCSRLRANEGLELLICLFFVFFVVSTSAGCSVFFFSLEVCYKFFVLSCCVRSSLCFVGFESFKQITNLQICFSRTSKLIFIFKHLRNVFNLLRD